MTWDQLIPDPINLHGGEQDIAGLTDWIWDQSLLTVRINTRTGDLSSEVASSKPGNKC